MWCQVKRKLLFQSTKLEVLQWLSTHEVGHWLYSSWNSPLFWDIQFVIARHRVFHSLLIHAFMLSNLSNSIRLFCQTNLLFCSYEDLSFEWKVPVVLELWCINMICSSEWIDVMIFLRFSCPKMRLFIWLVISNWAARIIQYLTSNCRIDIDANSMRTIFHSYFLFCSGK